MNSFRPFSIAFFLLLVSAGLGATTAPHKVARTQHPSRQEARAAAVPAPESVFGFKAGADYHLADFEQVTKYFQALASASPRIQLQNIGPTGFGPQMFIAFISIP